MGGANTAGAKFSRGSLIAFFILFFCSIFFLYSNTFRMFLYSQIYYFHFWRVCSEEKYRVWCFFSYFLFLHECVVLLKMWIPFRLHRWMCLGLLVEVEGYLKFWYCSRVECKKRFFWNLGINFRELRRCLMVCMKEWHFLMHFLEYFLSIFIFLIYR